MIAVARVAAVLVSPEVVEKGRRELADPSILVQEIDSSQRI